jgi:hypothetical protein
MRICPIKRMGLVFGVLRRIGWRKGEVLMVDIRGFIRFCGLLLLRIVELLSDLALKVHRWLKKNA